MLAYLEANPVLRQSEEWKLVCPGCWDAAWAPAERRKSANAGNKYSALEILRAAVMNYGDQCCKCGGHEDLQLRPDGVNFWSSFNNSDVDVSTFAKKMRWIADNDFPAVFSLWCRECVSGWAALADPFMEALEHYGPDCVRCGATAAQVRADDSAFWVVNGFGTRPTKAQRRKRFRWLKDQAWPAGVSAWCGDCATYYWPVKDVSIKRNRRGS